MNNVFSKYTDLETFNKINDYTCMNQMWVDAVENYGNNVCVFDKTEYTYNDLDNSVGNFRSILKQKGIKPGDIVAMYLPNCIDFVKAYLAITTLGLQPSIFCDEKLNFCVRNGNRWTFSLLSPRLVQSTLLKKCSDNCIILS